ncbi:hypothetical protein IM792_08810 [Mucilaginibacter sp. JRF]|uniref:hypothetical protein n=1 Tax=Mucilaginibacter sp. JRF TaxID=2780088 RepID=UPI001882047E|nr:hypothetical protein [Mucilaginibacter sp. JRF]MBE9584545.1 hypothetical protein [Mucilaginibacter sp. JRF]
MKKRKQIRKQLEKIYLNNGEKFSKADQFLFKLLIVKLGKMKKITLVILIIELLKRLIDLIFTESRPGSFFYSSNLKV